MAAWHILGGGNRLENVEIQTMCYLNHGVFLFDISERGRISLAYN